MKKTTKIVISISVIILFASVTSMLLLKQETLHKFLNHPVIQYEGKEPTCTENGHEYYDAIELINAVHEYGGWLLASTRG